jgi:hypothetical protein
MLAVNDIYFEEIVTDSLIGVIHPGFAHLSNDCKQVPIFHHEAVEKRKESTAFISDEKSVIYAQGCFFGGTRKEFNKMAKTIASNIDKDFEKRTIATWHDESHLNKYFNDYGYENMDFLTPNYAHPQVYDILPSRKGVGYAMFEKQFGLSPKIIHLYKGN